MAYDLETEKKIDLLIIIGGDGSVLWALQYFKNKVPPVLAFGRVTLHIIRGNSIIGCRLENSIGVHFSKN